MIEGVTTDKMLSRKDGAIGYLIFNNPERRNAVSQEMWAAIPYLLDDLENDPAIRVIVVTGAGDKAFVSGADISEFEKRRSNAAEAEVYAGPANEGRRRLEAGPKPTIAMIRGYCMGGGLAVAMNCDIRIATETARFGVPAAKLGIAYLMPALTALMQLVGPAKTKEILYTGRQYSAAEALSMGLVNQIVPEAELESVVAEMANVIASNAPLSVAASKIIVNELCKPEADQEPAMCEALSAACFDSEDFIEGRKAFMEKRKPVFVGR